MQGNLCVLQKQRMVGERLLVPEFLPFSGY